MPNISEWLEAHHTLLSVIAGFGALLISLVNILKDGFTLMDLNPIMVAFTVFAATWGAKKETTNLKIERDKYSQSLLRIQRQETLDNPKKGDSLI